MERVMLSCIDWGVASRPLGDVLGDAALVHPLPDGALIGVVDGIGHGKAAAEASRIALRLLERADGRDPLAVLKLCHDGLRATRGVVLALAWVDGRRGRLTWLGVGNVLGVLVRGGSGADPRPVELIGRHGVVGRQIPPLQPASVSVAPGDLLILATDGIHPDFIRRARTSGAPRKLADAILAEHGTGTDDALVLVVRYQGVPE